MDGPDRPVQERRKLLEEWCIQAVNTKYQKFFTARTSPKQTSPAQQAEEETKVDSQENTDASRPIALRKGKRKAHPVEHEDLAPEPKLKKQDTKIIDEPAPKQESVREELQKWFSGAASECYTSDSTDVDSLLGDDVELLDVPAEESEEGADEQPKLVRADFGWSRAYRKWKKPLVMYPSLNGYELAVLALKRKAASPAEPSKQPKGARPETVVETRRNSFIGAFNQYYDDAGMSPIMESASTGTHPEPLGTTETTSPTDIKTKPALHTIPAQNNLKNSGRRKKSSFMDFSPHLDKGSEWINNQTVRDRPTSLI